MKKIAYLLLILAVLPLALGAVDHNNDAEPIGSATPTVWYWTLGSVFLVSIVSLVGIFLFGVKKQKLTGALLILVALAAGTLIGDAFLHLLPHFAEEHGFGISAGVWILAGIIGLFILERFLHWHHCHKPHHEHNHIHPFAWNVLAADALHNFLDGALIAASYLVSVPVGVASTIAVLLHEIPQEVADFGVLVHAGFTKNKALLVNFLSALTAVVGAVITLGIVNAVEVVELFLIPFTAGAFIYIAMADLLPELSHEEHPKKMLLHFGMFLLGIGIMAALLLIE